MIDPATLAFAGGTFVTFWGAKKLLVWINRPKNQEIPRTQSIESQITSLQHWHMLWSHPDNNTEFYEWNDEQGWIERDINRVVKDMLGWDNYSYGVRSKVDRKIGTQWVDGEWGVDHLEKVLDYGVFLVKDLLAEFEEAEIQQALEGQRRARERKQRALEQSKADAAARAEQRVKLDAEYRERKRIDKAWQDSGKCRFCAGPRHGFSRDYCSGCWYARDTQRQGKLSKHPDEYKTRIPIESHEDSIRRIWELKAQRIGSFEYTPGPQRYALDSGTISVIESRLRRMAKLTEAIRQCDDGEMRRRLIQRLDEMENE